MKNYPYYSHNELNTVKELLVFCSETYPDCTAFRFQEKKQTTHISFRHFRQEVEALTSYLYEQDFGGCHVALLGENSYPWIRMHFAVLCGKGVAVPLDKDLSPEDAVVLIKDSDTTLLAYSHDYEDIALKIKELLPELSIQDMDRLSLPSETPTVNFCQAVNAPVGEDLASIVFTSGTTGRSKGVMLTHRNLMSDLYGASCNAMIAGTSILLLPLHHTFGLVAGLYSVMYYGYTLYISRSLKRVLKDFQEAKPQNTFVVPLIVETLHKNIWLTAKKQGKAGLLKRLITLSNLLRSLGIDLRKRLFKRVLEPLGGKLEVIICGGAPLKPELVKEFDAFGITLLNGYGITECSPIVAVNRNRHNVIGSVGFPLCCNEVKLSPTGEILVRGDNVMIGYYKSPLDNKDAFTDGWFHTGDLGSLDDQGALFITGRIKNLIILSNGENVPAEQIEEFLYQIPYVTEAIAYGENNQIVAELYLDPEVAEAKDMIHKAISRLNDKLPFTHRIGQIRLREEEFPKTTTRKIKRNIGRTSHAGNIDTYSD
ncbi:MAG: AMP-binding protein [Oscillospiraceae bacterium]|nr:AMP-binding protein [Oscillospiraceae bacterium]